LSTATQSKIEQARQRVHALTEHDGFERRWATVDRAEVRATRKDGSYDFEGHAAVFDELSDDLGFREIIKRGAFKGTLEDDVRFLFNHDPNLVLARSVSGTLELSEDPRGLLVKANVAPTSYAQDIRVLLERGDVSQMSFAFITDEDEWHEDEETGQVTRTVHKFRELFDVSVVTYPAYPQTDAVARGLRKLRRGETIDGDEREALASWLTPISHEPSPSEQEARADAQEPSDQAEVDAGQVVESPKPQGLSRAAARLRTRALVARF
jgi:uncharacterized protein